MSSYKRIPGKLIKKSEQKISINDEFAIEEAIFKETITDKMINDVKVELKEKREEMIEEINSEKEQMIENIREEVKEEVLIEAKESIKDEYENILKEANKIYEKANNHYKKIIEETEEYRNKFLEDKQEEIIDFFLLSINKILKQEVNLENIKVEKIYDELIKEIKYDTRKIYVRVNPETESILNIYKKANLDKRIEFIYDLNLDKTEFICETDREYIDFTIASQLEKIREILKGGEI